MVRSHSSQGIILRKLRDSSCLDSATPRPVQLKPVVSSHLFYEALSILPIHSFFFFLRLPVTYNLRTLEFVDVNLAKKMFIESQYLPMVHILVGTEHWGLDRAHNLMPLDDWHIRPFREKPGF